MEMRVRLYREVMNCLGRYCALCKETREVYLALDLNPDEPEPCNCML